MTKPLSYDTPGTTNYSVFALYDNLFFVSKAPRRIGHVVDLKLSNIQGVSKKPKIIEITYCSNFNAVTQRILTG